MENLILRIGYIVFYGLVIIGATVICLLVWGGISKYFIDDKE